MKQKTECMYCGKPFFSSVKKMFVVWLCNVTELETTTESGQTIVIHDKQKLKTCGAVDSYEKAENFTIKGIKDGQCKDIEKVMTLQEQFCAKCKHDAKVYHDRVIARMKKQARERAISGGDKSGKIAFIPDKDFRGYLRYLVDQRINSDYKKEQQRQEQINKAEERKRLMDEKQKLNKADELLNTEEQKHV
jgi:hypothetical protein